MDDDVRRELDQLHQADRDLRQVLTDLDSHGSRGVQVLQGQVTDLVRDVTSVQASVTAMQQLVDTRLSAMKQTVDGQLSEHLKQHKQDADERRSNRRWIAATAIAGISGLATIIGILINILGHIH